MSSKTTVKYAHLFVDGDDQYLFATKLGNGAQSYAQLMWHIHSGELRVRKERARVADVEPNIVRIFSGGDVPARQEQAGDPQRWHRVVWMSYMNGGHLNDFRIGCSKRGLTVPRSLILRLVHQVTSTLQFMYEKPAVFHRDMHSANIFLNWVGDSELPDFCIGDFGRAVHADDDGGFKLWDAHVKTLFEEGFQPYEYDVQCLRSHVRALLACPLGRAKKGSMEAEPDIVKQVMTKLDEIANPPMSPGSPPDLTGLLGLLSNAPALPNGPQGNADFKFGLQDANGVSPLYHDTMDECLQVKQVHGPWYCAKTKKRTIQKRNEKFSAAASIRILGAIRMLRHKARILVEVAKQVTDLAATPVEALV
ncbi:hypothetical protein VMCG_06878 [Cytospora schulzeri]|uniref:Protein kinase domain-containing protein n=1 Tax=Cytospora schulzeri TaxID=448051 RepID=A0A423W264_9PEZI|nr:hypothetical protein VMCG_06878 [Valsa malicola]